MSTGYGIDCRTCASMERPRSEYFTGEWEKQ